MTHVVNTELVQSLGNLNLLGGIEEGIGKLLSFTKSRLNDLESTNIAQEVSYWLVWVVRWLVWVDSRLDTGITWVSS